jgi:hypothetical protein
MSRGAGYCLACGERWTDNADRHQMKCAARPLLLAGNIEGARVYRTESMDAAPKPTAVRPSTRASRAFRCADCDRPWSIYAANHERGCRAAYLLARGQRETAKLRWRIRPGMLAKPDAVPLLSRRFDFTRGKRRAS